MSPLPSPCAVGSIVLLTAKLSSATFCDERLPVSCGHDVLHESLYDPDVGSLVEECRRNWFRLPGKTKKSSAEKEEGKPNSAQETELAKTIHSRFPNFETRSKRCDVMCNCSVIGQVRVCDVSLQSTLNKALQLTCVDVSS